MKTWIKRTLLGVAALVVVAVGAVFALATLGDRKLERQSRRRRRRRAAGQRRGQHRARRLPVPLARLRRLPQPRRQRQGRGRGRQEHADPRPQPHHRAGRRDRRLQAGRLGALHPPRRQAERPAGAHHAERGIQPLHRCRPRGGRLLHPPAAAEGRRRRHHPPAAAGARALRRRRVQGRVGEDRPSPGAGAAGRRRRDRGPWRLCRQWLQRLPSRPT
mgnify:CR=1 FL=1